MAMDLRAVATTYSAQPAARSVASCLLSALELLGIWRDQGYAVFTDADFGAQIQVIDDGRAWGAA